MIGTLRPDKLTCDDEHLPGCFNPHLNVTACICGQAWWVGNVGTWHSVERFGPEPALPSLGIGIGAPGLQDQRVTLGWDTYYLHADHCPKSGPLDPCNTCDPEAVPTDYRTAAKRAREATA